MLPESMCAVICVLKHFHSYQNYVVVRHPEMLVPVPEEVPLDQAAIVTCSGITAYNTIQTLKPSLDETIRTKG